MLPNLVKEAINKSELIHLNQDNLLHGKTSEGGDMPPYSRNYRMGNLYYRDYKMRSNSFNRGRWDLKHWWFKKYDGMFYKSIKVKVTIKEVVFDTSYDPDYMRQIYYYVTKSRILGITKTQWRKVQIDNIPAIRAKLLEIINNG